MGGPGQSTFRFLRPVATITETALRSCDVWFSAQDNGWADAETVVLFAWLNTTGHYMVAGCNTVGSHACQVDPMLFCTSRDHARIMRP
jgi:hypothetical protein